MLQRTPARFPAKHDELRGSPTIRCLRAASYRNRTTGLIMA
jgi:hypothetical protein